MVALTVAAVATLTVALATLALGLALTTRGNSAVTPPGLRGFVRAIAFDQVETILILRFSTTGPATVNLGKDTRFRADGCGPWVAAG